MRQLLAVVVATAFLVTLAPAVDAANWTKVGTSEFKMTVGGGPSQTPGVLKDRQRIKFGAIAVDPAGNVYAAANNAAQAPAPEPGGLTIFKANGDVINVNLNALGFVGPITKMVVGGDGLVYALQNFIQMGWDFFPAYPNRVLQITSNGVVTQIWCPDQNQDGNCDGVEWESASSGRINGITVGGDGNVYFTANSRNSYWRFNLLWRYDVAQGMVEKYPQTMNNGWLIQSRMFDIEYVGQGNDGEDYFALIDPSIGPGPEWQLTSLRWVENVSGDPNVDNYRDGIRRLVADGRANPGWGRDWITGIAYDPGTNKLHVGSRGVGGSLIQTRFDGDPGNPGLFTHWDPVEDRTMGLVGPQLLWHANRNDPLASDMPNGDDYWIQAMAVNPDDGHLWTSYGANPNYVFQDIGRVTIHGVDNPAGEYYDAGMPEENAWVMGLAFHNGRVYALTLSFDTNEYSVYYTDDTTPQPRGPQIGDVKNSINGMTVTTGEAVVTFPYPNAELTNYFYIQDADRSSGIRVIPADAATVVMLGDRVTVSGTTMMLNGQAVITNAVVTAAGSGPEAEPLHVVVRNLGGKASALQPAVAPGNGMNNTGLFVRVSGTMTEYSTDDQGLFFRLDDGSNAMLGGAVPGVKIRGIPPAGAPGAFLKAVGVVSTEWDADTQKWVPIILTRDFMDIELVSP